MIRRALGEGVIAIEHVGSTSVPGMPGRPILDILVGLVGPEPTRAQFTALVQLGYGRPRRRAGRIYVRRGTPRIVTAHLAQWGGQRWWRLVDFRDHLLADTRAADRYAELKRTLAGGHHAQYADAKRRFVESELRRVRRSR